MALSTSTDGSISNQTNTQNPQTAGQPTTDSAQSSSVQPGTATALLTNQQGIQLNAPVLPTVTVGSSTSSTATTNTATPPAKHHVNTALLGLPALLIIGALVLFWVTNRSVKNTTE